MKFHHSLEEALECLVYRGPQLGATSRAILTVTRLGLPTVLSRSLACTNIIGNMTGTVRRVCRNVKRWVPASMALRWTAAAMLEAKKGFRKLKAYKQLPALRAALIAHAQLTSNKPDDRHLDHTLKVA